MLEEDWPGEGGGYFRDRSGPCRGLEWEGGGGVSMGLGGMLGGRKRPETLRGGTQRIRVLTSRQPVDPSYST